MAQTNPETLGKCIQYQLASIVTPVPVYAAFNRNFATEPKFITWSLRNVHQPVYTGQIQSIKGIDTPIFQVSIFTQKIEDGFTISNQILQSLHGYSAQFVAKTGNATNGLPWGYTVQPNVGTPGTNTTIWQLPTRVISAQLPIRTAAMSDINYLNETLVEDLMLEFSAIEAASMADNNDQAGSTTLSTGDGAGLRGLNYYPGAAGATAAYGTSGTAITNGLHTLATVGHLHTSVDYESLADLANALPPQYWGLPGTAWHMHPTYIAQIRQYAHGGGGYSLVETGELGEGPAINILGWPVIPNPYLDPTGTVGNFPVYLANWPQFMTIADVEEMSIQVMEQTLPGFVTLYAEKRMVSTVRNPFAGVRLIET